MAKFCPNCGKELTENSDYCMGCGKLLNNNSPKQKKGKRKVSTLFIVIAAFLIAFVLIPLIVDAIHSKKYGEDTDEQTVKSNSEKIKEYFDGNWTAPYFTDITIEEDIETKSIYNISLSYNDIENSIYTCGTVSKNVVSDIINDSEINSFINGIKFSCKKGSLLNNYIEYKTIYNLNETEIEKSMSIMDKDENIINTTLEKEYANDIAEYKGKCKSYSYEKIFRYAEDYNGKFAKFTGKVVQVIEDGDLYEVYRVDVTKDKWGYYDDTIYVFYADINDFTSRILEDDIITIYGELDGLYTYETVLGANVTIPKINAKYIYIK